MVRGGRGEQQRSECVSHPPNLSPQPEPGPRATGVTYSQSTCNALLVLEPEPQGLNGSRYQN